MASRATLIGRDSEFDRLREHLERAVGGEGGLVLVAGEAGVGKTRLMDELSASAGVLVLRGGARQDATPAYGPVAAALRAYLHAVPGGLDDCGPLGDQLRLLLPELGDPPEEAGRAGLIEAVRCAFAALSEAQGALIVLDDLQWSDAATLEMLAGLGPTLRELPLLVLGAYRSDELPRDHPLRRMRNELRRAGALDEVAVESLDPEGAAGLIERTLDGPPSAALVRAIYDRSQGLPFFVEELAGALGAEGRLQRGATGLELPEGSDVAVPDTVRDAVLLRTAGLSPAGQAAAQVAAVAGEQFELESVAELADESGVGELLDQALVVECGDSTGAFRHALVRESLYRDVPWLQRRSLHRRLAERLEGRGAPGVEVATQWLGAHEEARARPHLLRAAEEFHTVHAYRDAATMARRALELWPEDEAVDERLLALERHGVCAELAGELADAARAWRELSSIHREGDRGPELADAQRRLGRVYAMQGDRAGATEALLGAADAFAASADPAAAAAARLTAADYLQFAGRHEGSLELSRRAAEEARRAERIDLQSRAMAAEGVVLAKRGSFEPGLELVQNALSLALEHNLTTEAADAYQRLGTVFEQAGDYGSAMDALDSALGLCRVAGETGPEAGCVACMAYVLRELGEWPRAMELSRELIAAHDGDGVRTVADGVLGSIQALRGELGPARRTLSHSFDCARRLDILSMQVDCAASMALVADYDSDTPTALGHCRFLLSRWEESEDHHYAIWALRVAASLLAQAGERDDAHACAQGLTRIASATGHPDALAALASALGETALLDGEPELAAEQFGRAVELHRSLRIPAERAQILYRAGTALAAAGDRETAIERHAEAYRIARKLRARPLAGRAARAIEELGESAEQRLGRTAVTAANGGGLSRRELEVLRHVADGRTNREIAGELFLSPRTVDMHVRNILAKLDCRSRVEASARAGELGILGAAADRSA